MLTYQELHQQNHQITELANVLQSLFQDRSMVDNHIVCDLFYRFIDKVQKHLDQVDQLYSVLLSDEDQRVNNVARLFMSGEQEIKRIIGGYTRKWCNKDQGTLKVAQHEVFLADTQQVFHMILARIQDETEKLYPAVRTLRGDNLRAA